MAYLNATALCDCFVAQLSEEYHCDSWVAHIRRMLKLCLLVLGNRHEVSLTTTLEFPAISTLESYENDRKWSITNWSPTSVLDVERKLVARSTHWSVSPSPTHPKSRKPMKQCMYLTVPTTNEWTCIWPEQLSQIWIDLNYQGIETLVVTIPNHQIILKTRIVGINAFNPRCSLSRTLSTWESLGQLL